MHTCCMYVYCVRSIAMVILLSLSLWFCWSHIFTGSGVLLLAYGWEISRIFIILDRLVVFLLYDRIKNYEIYHIEVYSYYLCVSGFFDRWSSQNFKSDNDQINSSEPHHRCSCMQIGQASRTVWISNENLFLFRLPKLSDAGSSYCRFILFIYF